MHVKTELGRREILDVLKSTFNALESAEPQRNPAEIWSGAIFFAHTECDTEEKCAARLSEVIEGYLKEVGDRRARVYLPQCIAIVNGPIAILGAAGGAAGKTSLRIFGCDKLSPAILLSHLYDSFPSNSRDMRKRGEWVQLLQQKSYKILLERELS